MAGPGESTTGGPSPGSTYQRVRVRILAKSRMIPLEFGSRMHHDARLN